MEREEIIRELAAVFRAEREKLGLTRSALALRAGCSEAFVTYVEHGRQCGLSKMVVRLARELQIDTNPETKLVYQRFCDMKRAYLALAPDQLMAMAPEEIIKVVADILHARRTELGLSRHDLANRIHASDSFVCKIEAGNFSGSAGKVKDLAKALGVDTHPAYGRLCEIVRPVGEMDRQRQEHPHERPAPAKRSDESKLKIIARSVRWMRWGHEMPIDELAYILEVTERNLRRFEYGEVDAISGEAVQKLPGAFECGSLPGMMKQAAMFESRYAKQHGEAFLKNEIRRRIQDSAGPVTR